METKEKQPKEKVVEDFKQNDFSQSIIDQMKEKREVLGKSDNTRVNKPSFSERLLEKEGRKEEPPKNEEAQKDSFFEKLMKEKAEDTSLNDQFKKEEKNNLDKKAPIIEPPKREVPTPPKSPEIIKKPTTEEIVFRKNINPEKDGKIVAGWLVVHTENRLPVTYQLFEGKNVIGRPDGPHHVDVLIEEDRYVSREHCFIDVQKDFVHRFMYILHDGKDNRSSTNGTFINGLTERMEHQHIVYLKDGDIVQVGETKLAFKNAYESSDYQEAANSVINTDYTKTVAINYKPNR